MLEGGGAEIKNGGEGQTLGIFLKTNSSEGGDCKLHVREQNIICI